MDIRWSPISSALCSPTRPSSIPCVHEDIGAIRGHDDAACVCDAYWLFLRRPRQHLRHMPLGGPEEKHGRTLLAAGHERAPSRRAPSTHDGEWRNDCAHGFGKLSFGAGGYVEGDWGVSSTRITPPLRIDGWPGPDPHRLHGHGGIRALRYSSLLSLPCRPRVGPGQIQRWTSAGVRSPHRASSAGRSWILASR